jgi:hypothetical protein
MKILTQFQVVVRLRKEGLPDRQLSARAEQVLNPVRTVRVPAKI